jgi:hypothetical protein
MNNTTSIQDQQATLQTARCPFCDGDGCCNCDYEGRVRVGIGMPFRTVQEAESHDPEVSYFDLKWNRKLGQNV